MDLVASLAAIKSKRNNKQVSNISNPLFTKSCQDQRNIAHKTHFEMEIPRFDGSDPLGWSFKINHFFNFHNTPEQ